MTRKCFRRPDWADEFEAAGHEIGHDGTIIVYHATTAAGAKQILRDGVLRRPKDAPDSYGVYFSTSPDVARDYGDGTLVRLNVHVNELHLDDVFPDGRMDFTARTYDGIYVPRSLEVIERGAMPNPWLAYGWVLPDGQYVPVDGQKHQDHKGVAAKIMRMRNKEQAFRRALDNRWIRVGEATIQLPSPPDDSAFLRAVDHVRETSPADQDWDIRIEWWVGNNVLSYKVPILEFMEMDGIGDLSRYPKEVW